MTAQAPAITATPASQPLKVVQDRRDRGPYEADGQHCEGGDDQEGRHQALHRRDRLDNLQAGFRRRRRRRITGRGRCQREAEQAGEEHQDAGGQHAGAPRLAEAVAGDAADDGEGEADADELRLPGPGQDHPLGLASVPMRRAMAASATQNRAVKTRPVTPSSGFVSQRRRASAVCSPGMLYEDEHGMEDHDDEEHPIGRRCSPPHGLRGRAGAAGAVPVHLEQGHRDRHEEQRQ